MAKSVIPDRIPRTKFLVCVAMLVQFCLLAQAQTQIRPWVKLSLPLDSTAVTSFNMVTSPDSLNVFVATSRGIHHSGDGGRTWQDISGILSGRNVSRIWVNTTLGIVAWGDSMFYSTDLGQTWTVRRNVSNGAYTPYGVIWTPEGKIYCVVGDWMTASYDTGKSWIYPWPSTIGVGVRHCGVYSGQFYVAWGYTVFEYNWPHRAWTYGGIRYCNDPASFAWVSLDSSDSEVINGCAMSPRGQLYKSAPSGFYVGGVRISTFSGFDQMAFTDKCDLLLIGGRIYCSPQWNALDDGLGASMVRTMATNKRGSVFALTSDGVYQNDSFVEGLTRAADEISDLPDECVLALNYPNPFNPSTTIGFRIPATAHTTLIIVDILGNRVATLLDRELTPGHYSEAWNASHQAAGVYFCILQSGSQIRTTKLLLLK